MRNYQALVERVLDPKGKSGSEILYACPNCEDPVKGHHLQVNYNKGYFNCFKCSLGGKKLSTLLRILGIDEGLDYTKVESSEYSDELDKLLKDSLKPNTIKPVLDYSSDHSITTAYLLSHTKELTPYARGYLYSRGFDDSLINYYGIREGLDLKWTKLNIKGKQYMGTDYSGRILIPSLRKDGNVSFYVARDYTGLKEPKYMNPPKDIAYSSEDVWNLDVVDTDSVIICEGVITAMSVCKALSKNIAVATYGKSIAEKSNSENTDIIVTSQGEKLLNKKFSTYFVFYDLDAREESFKTMKYLHDRGANVRYVEIGTDKYGPKADAANLTRDELLECIHNSKVYDEFLDLGI